MSEHSQAKAIIKAAVISLIGTVILGLFTLAAAFVARSNQGDQRLSTPTVTIETTQTASAPITSIPAAPRDIPTASSRATQPTLASPPAPAPTRQAQPTSSVGEGENQVIRITARGTGLPQPTATNSAMRKKTAVTAAELDAKRKFAEWLNGAEIESVTIVEGGALTKDEIRQVVKAKIPAYDRVVEEVFDEVQGIAYVTLEWVITR
ncbi:MAG: hypothetical protein RMN25_09905 [Anaerolineae bacterium]|nr:hypothetical protein [Thermoflexales bacterium]MDW8408082.1 hypothetical protein [Anaerolineae bacterium]